VRPTRPSASALLEDPLIHGLDDTDGNWYHSRSLVNFVDRIDVPVHITSAYQDEQTGPRGPTYVFDKLLALDLKRLVLVNGVHGTNTEDPSSRTASRGWTTGC
jgi:hypothetical protein